MNKVYKAIEVMICAHGQRQRKYTKLPYSVHPLRVLSKVEDYLTWSSSQIYQKDREDMLCVAALHDVVEEEHYPIEKLEATFGKIITEGILALTNPSIQHPQLSRELRKEMDRKHYETIADKWKIVKMWNRIDNLYDMNKAKPAKIFTYVSESRLLNKVLRGADQKVGERLMDAANWLELITKDHHQYLMAKI